MTSYHLRVSLQHIVFEPLRFRHGWAVRLDKMFLEYMYAKESRDGANDESSTKLTSRLAEQHEA